MLIKGLNHLAFITDDMTKTVRFYRDLLGMTLQAGIGHDGYRHYFFQMGTGQVAFFEYAGASPMRRGKSHGEPTREEALFALKDKLDAADLEVSGAVDHGTMWSIYFFDPNNIPLEASWDCMEILKAPAIEDDDPLPVASEGAGPQPDHWPEVMSPTPASGMFAHAGNGITMRESFLKRGLARMLPGLNEPAMAEVTE
jgi:catechol 2,3-dioxygenase-like lactoylglutathione lyase family enzyme